MSKLPQYQSHKVVGAAKITAIAHPNDDIYPALIFGELKPHRVQPVGNEWFSQHKPEVGGYFVEYQDGYCSYSPAEAFEQGYRPVKEEPNPLQGQLQGIVDDITAK